MRWAIARHQQVIYRGSRADCLDWAERYGLLLHVGDELDDAGEPRRALLCGRGYHQDGTELPCRLSPGVVMMPERMLPRRWQRRAA